MGQLLNLMLASRYRLHRDLERSVRLDEEVRERVDGRDSVLWLRMAERSWLDWNRKHIILASSHAR